MALFSESILSITLLKSNKLFLVIVINNESKSEFSQLSLIYNQQDQITN